MRCCVLLFLYFPTGSLCYFWCLFFALWCVKSIPQVCVAWGARRLRRKRRKRRRLSWCFSSLRKTRRSHMHTDAKSTGRSSPRQAPTRESLACNLWTSLTIPSASRDCSAGEFPSPRRKSSCQSQSSSAGDTWQSGFTAVLTTFKPLDVSGSTWAALGCLQRQVCNPLSHLMIFGYYKTATQRTCYSDVIDNRDYTSVSCWQRLNSMATWVDQK